MSIEIARAKAEAFAEGLDSINSGDRRCLASHTLAQQYNALVAFARQAAPDVDADAWPIAVQSDDPKTAATFQDLAILTKQVVAVLEDA